MNSSYTIEHQQKDGRRWVNERHIDAAGEVFLWSYLANDKADKDQILADHATVLQTLITDDQLRALEQKALQVKLSAALTVAEQAGTLTDADILKLGLTVGATK